MNLSQVQPDVRAMDPRRLIGLIIGHWQSSVLYVAERRGLFEFLSESARGRDLIGRHLGLPARSRDALIDGCLGLDLIRETPAGLSLTDEAAAFLVRGRAGYLGDWVREEARTFSLWNDLEHSLEAGRPVGPVDSNGYFVAPPEFRTFLHGVSSRVALELCDVLSFRGERVLDLGGGSGAFAVAIARSSEDSSVLVVDRPEVCDIAQSRLTDEERSHSVTFHGADFFRDDLPSDFDTVLIANVLHDWSIDQSRLLLEKALRSLRPGGRIVLTEVVPSVTRSDDPVSALLSLSFCLTMTHGYCYDEEVYRELLESVGLRGVHRHDLPRTGKLVLSGAKEAL